MCASGGCAADHVAVADPKGSKHEELSTDANLRAQHTRNTDLRWRGYASRADASDHEPLTGRDTLALIMAGANQG